MYKSSRGAFAALVCFILFGSQGWADEPAPAATCPAPITVAQETLIAHQWTSQLVDAAGVGWKQYGTLTAPYTQTETLISVPDCAKPPPPAIYWLQSNNLSPDDGWGAAVVGLYKAYNGACQKWGWDGSKLSTPVQGCNVPGYLAEAANKTGTMNAGGDPMLMLPSGAGYTIQNMRTGDYLMLSGTQTGAPGSLIFGATQTIWTATKQ